MYFASDLSIDYDMPSLTMMPFSRFSDYFIAVAQTGSLRKAAEQRFISVSAIHRQIALAEEEFGVELFERLPQGLRLTLAGEMLYTDLLKWRKEYQYTRARFDEIQGLNRGNIQIGMISALATDGLILESIQHLQQLHPGIHLNLQVAETEIIIQKIVQSELDFALVVNPKAHSQLQIIDFIELPIGFVVHPNHALATQQQLYFSDTLDTVHIIPNAPLMIHDYAQSLYKRYQITPAQQIQSNDIRLINTMLQQNLGLSILSYLDVYPYLKNQSLKFIPIQAQGLQPFRLALCIAPKRQISKAASILMKHTLMLLDEIRKQVDLLNLSPNH